MFHHVKELQFDARVSQPDPRFASLLLEQFGGGNGELKACMQYFVQAFAVRQSHPELYDLLMDVATEELSHLEIVGATIQMLLGPINGELKDAANKTEWMHIVGDKGKREDFIHEAVMDPQFLAVSGGGVKLTDSQGNPWTANYVNANGDPTVDLRSDIAAESRAKIVYEYLMQFTDDPYVEETLGFLMTREVAHFQMFAAALESIQPNFPPGVLQGNPKYTHAFYNMSNGADARGPWNDGQGPWPAGEEWTYIADPVEQVIQTQGQVKKKAEGSNRSMKEADKIGKELSKMRSMEVKSKLPKGENQWSGFPQDGLQSPKAGKSKGPSAKK